MLTDVKLYVGQSLLSLGSAQYSAPYLCRLIVIYLLDLGSESIVLVCSSTWREDRCSQICKLYMPTPQTR